MCTNKSTSITVPVYGQVGDPDSGLYECRFTRTSYPAQYQMQTKTHRFLPRFGNRKSESTAHWLWKCPSAIPSNNNNMSTTSTGKSRNVPVDSVPNLVATTTKMERPVCPFPPPALGTYNMDGPLQTLCLPFICTGSAVCV